MQSGGGSWGRDLLEVNRLIDSWSLLGLPLLVMVTAPSGDAADSLAERPGRPLPQASSGGNSLESQAAIVRRLAPLLISKQSVHAVIWNQWCDGEPHEFPHGGLLDTQHQPKPALAELANLRREHLT